MDIFVLLATMFFCFFVGVPIAYSLGLAAIAAALWIGIPLEAVMLKISDGVSKVAMLTIPFFVLAGAIMAEGGMARRMVAFADVLVGFTRVRGGLSVVNVLATTFLSGISGSAVADTSAIGSVMIPQMEKSGFPRVFATNVTITASVQALLVPPSHNAVIYSLATGGTISIISLFMAGVVPGLLLAILAAQMSVGRQVPAFPRRIAAHPLPTRHLVRMGRQPILVLKSLERVIRPRWPTPFGATKRVIGIVVLLLTSLILLAPVPLTNVPPAAVIALISLAVNTAVFTVAYHRLGNLPAAALGVLAGMCVTYLVCDLLIFRDRRTPRTVRGAHRRPRQPARAARPPVATSWDQP